MIPRKKFYLLLVLAVSSSLSNTAFSSHNTNRYFPFLERSDNYLYRKKSYAHASLFYATASTAFKTGGGNAGMFELSGKYDLKDVFRSLDEFKKFTMPKTFSTELNSFTDKTEFKAEGKIKTRGLTLQYDQDLKWHNLSIGAWLPIVLMNTTGRFNPADKTLSFNEKVNLNELRRTIHENLDLRENNWDKGGCGDLDTYLRWNYYAEHKLLMRSFNIDIIAGCLFPTGIKTDPRHFSSVPAMGNGHWGMYVDLAPEFELKQNLKFGFIFGTMYQFKKTKTRRIPMYNEPAIFSPLVGKASIDPGMTFKLSPYLILENLTDGLHFQARYTYLRHNTDTWKDVRTDAEQSNYPSYLTRKPTADITQEKIGANIANKKYLSKWRAHYITLQCLYNSKDALHNLPFDPNIYVMYDLPINGRGIGKTHQISLGVELHF
ncbi:MAG: hypothetical protein V1855_03930 [bacterium]